MGAAAAPQFDTYSAPSGPKVIAVGTDNPVITSRLTRASEFYGGATTSGFPTEFELVFQ
jgi:hypothetical protein